MMLRLVGALAIVVAFVAAGSAGTDTRSGVPAGNAQGTYRAAVFVTLPMTNGFADATGDLVEAQGLVHEALGAVDTVRLVDRPQDSDVVLTVLGRGTGHVELTSALRALDRGVIASPVMIRATERYIEAMLTVGSCGDAATSAASQSESATCYRKIFVGLGFTDGSTRQGDTKTAPNSWKTCASALARDVQAWVTQNANRLLERRSQA